MVGCATSMLSPHYVKTVSSDLYPTEMSRDQYYEEMGRAYAKENVSEKAIENFKLALLHNPARTTAHIQLSDEYRKIEMNQLAANELTEVLKQNPKNTEALIKLGDLYLSAQIFSKAKENFQSVLEINPQNENAKWFLFYIARLEKDDVIAEKYLNTIPKNTNNKVKLLFEKALLAKRFNRMDEYAALIKKAYEENPHDKSICLARVSDLVEKSDFDSAWVLLSRYKQAHDFDYEISQKTLEVAVHLEQYEVAFEELDAQQKRISNPSDIELKKAHLYFLSGNLKKAEQSYEQLLSDNPDQDQAQFYLGQIYLHQNLNDLAQDALKRLTPSSVYYGEAQSWLAVEETKNHEPKIALKRLEKALSKRPDQLILYQTYSGLLIHDKKYRKVIQILEAANGFFPDNEDLKIQMAVAYFHIGKMDEFKKSIDEAIRINPENAEIYSNLAELWYLKKYNPKDIETWAQKALQFKTKNKNMKPLLAWALMAQNRSFGSVALFEKFYEENPKQPFYAEALSKVYEAADIPQKAELLGQQAVKLQNQKRLQSDLILEPQRAPAGQP